MKPVRDYELIRLGIDPQAWARHFCEVYPGIDRASVARWFEYAIDAGLGVGRCQAGYEAFKAEKENKTLEAELKRAIKTINELQDDLKHAHECNARLIRDRDSRIVFVSDNGIVYVSDNDEPE